MTMRGVFFDLGGVIVRTEDRAPRTTLGAEFGMDYAGIESVVFGGGALGTGARASVGAVTEEAHWQAVLRQLGLGTDHRQRVADQFFGGDKIDWEIVDFLRGLRKTHKVGLISNAWDGLRPWMRKQKFDDAFEYLTISAEVRVAKPAPGIYHHALKALGVKPEESLFVDDVLENIEACKKLGMHGVHFKNAAQALADVKTLLEG